MGSAVALKKATYGVNVIVKLTFHNEDTFETPMEDCTIS